MNLEKRLTRLESGGSAGKSARWRAEMDRHEESLAEGHRKLEEMVMDQPARTDGMTSDEMREAKRTLLKQLAGWVGAGRPK